MRENRKVDFLTKLGLVKQKPIQALFGFLFTLIPLFLVTLLSIVFTSMDNGLPKVNYDNVISNGNLTEGVIDEIEIQYNTQINGQHPAIITYSFEDGSEQKTSKVKTLEPNKVNELNTGDLVEVKYLNSKSVLIGFRPYNFPMWLIFFFPIPFLLIGLPFLITLVLRVAKEIKLYKHGRLVEGEILAMTPNSGLPVTNIGQSVSVHYQYKNSQGKRLVGKSKTTDFSILGDKKKGELVQVLVSETNETKSCLYPELTAIKNQW
jgi:hypothetical protein